MTRLLFFLPAIAYAALIFWSSAQSRLPETTLFVPGGDKLVHGAGYALLAGLTLWGARRSGVLRRLWPWMLLIGLYGATDELHQAFVDGRDASVLDWCADVAGALLCALLWQAWAPAQRAEPAKQDGAARY